MNKTLLLFVLFLSLGNLMKAQNCNPDTSPPSLLCINGLAVTLEPQDPPTDLNQDGILDTLAETVWAQDFIEALTDNCTNEPFLRMEFLDDGDGVTVPQDAALLFTQENIGISLLRIWAGDNTGNWDFCETYVLVNDSSNCAGDLVPPSAVCQSEVNVSLSAETGTVTVEAASLDRSSTDNCTDELNFTIALDGVSAPQSLLEFDEKGTYLVTLTAIDNANNRDQCQTYIQVSDSEGNPPDCSIDEIPPLALCSQDQVFRITTVANPFVLSASFLAAQSFDNCSSDLSFAIEEGVGSGEPPSDEFLYFDETQVGIKLVTVWVTDEQGNQNTCLAEINISSDFTRHIVAGEVFIDDGDCEAAFDQEKIAGVDVRVSLLVNGVTAASLISTTSGSFTPRYSAYITEFTPTRIAFAGTSIEYQEEDKIDVEVVLWENINTSCPNSTLFENITAGSNNTNLEKDFGISTESPCPELYLDVSAPFLRRCFETIYWVNYCNYGGVSAKDSEVQIVFDDYLEVLESAYPWSSVDGQTYTFDVGDIPPGDCGRFYIKVKISCDSELGQTHCTEAKITNSNDCNGESVFEGPELELKAKCEGGEVKFQVRNIGEDMTQSHHYIVIEDILMLQDGDTDILLNGEQQEFTLPANGSTFRLEVDQVATYPWTKVSGISLEGCGENESGDFSRGFVTQFAESDWRPDISIDCQENIGAFDPNDKQAFPKGVGVDKITKANTELEYMIRFQNTGTDTAFNVRIEDQLSELLDLTTVKPGASSHPYSFSIKDDRMMVFRFDNILLPDSTTNLEASNGFVKFSVQQLADNPIGSLIENTAAIYFDFNEPVITNTVQHLIGEPLVSSNDEPGRVLITATVTPNPFTESTTLYLENTENQALQIALFDHLGRKVRTESWQSDHHVLHREGLAPGIYFFTIQGRKGLLSEGRLIIQ
ncbi:MAG: T9SS type A sorting domain-containing protein [Saprospiraceae bacterium]|nr:T9SS type A sorting domain-containing protein [Saprospiraceae bacterium]